MRRFRWIPLLGVVAIFGALLTAIAQESAQDRRQIFQQIEGGIKALTEITGLPAKKPISYDLITRDKVNQFLKDRIKESSKPEEVRAEEITLKKLGFAPPEFNLEKSTVDLLTEQAAAFYDYHKKKLFLTDWAPSSMEQSALVHELAHAWADQNFRLERFINRGGQSDDSGLARMAVMEGQATWLMTEVLARRSGQTLIGNPSLIEAATAGSSTAEYPVFNSVPLYLRETLVFPYTEGARFQNAVVEKMGKAAFSEIFRRPPETSQQILHPEKYFEHIKPTEPRFASVSLGQDYKELTDGMLGELDHAILLRQFGTKQQAESIALHWKGGRYLILENKKLSRLVLQYSSDWDSPEIASDFFRFYRVVLGKKWKKIEISSESDHAFSGLGDDGYFSVTRTGNIVTSVEGLAKPYESTGSGVR